MSKLINNERGLTLIEVLAAVSLSVIVLSAAIALFINLSDFTLFSSEGRRSQNDAKYALSQISARLHDSKEVFRPNDANELRYSTFINGGYVYKAICYQGNEIWLYDFVGTEADWKDKDMSRSIDDDLYHNGHRLASNIVSAPIYREGETANTIVGIYGQGKRIDIVLSYQSERKTATGGSFQGNVVTVRTSVKLYTY